MLFRAQLLRFPFPPTFLFPQSWDRAAYFNDLRGYTSVTKLTDELAGNFILATYESQSAVDNDDSSAHFLTRDNVLVYGTYGQKTDFGGGDNVWSGNVVAFIQAQAMWTTWGNQLAGQQNQFTNNIVALTADGPWAWGQTCNRPDLPVGWTFQQGYLPEGGDILPPQQMTITDAKALCEATLGCWALCYEPGEPAPTGEVFVSFKSMPDAPFGNACCGTWTVRGACACAIGTMAQAIAPTLS